MLCPFAAIFGVTVGLPTFGVLVGVLEKENHGFDVGLGVIFDVPVGVTVDLFKKENQGFDVGLGVINGVTVGVTFMVVFDFGIGRPLMLNFPLATTIKTATTTRPKIKERALLNCSIVYELYHYRLYIATQFDFFGLVRNNEVWIVSSLWLILNLFLRGMHHFERIKEEVIVYYGFI